MQKFQLWNHFKTEKHLDSFRSFVHEKKYLYVKIHYCFQKKGSLEFSTK